MNTESLRSSASHCRFKSGWKLRESTENSRGPAAAAPAIQNLAACLGAVPLAETADAALLQLRVTNVDLHVFLSLNNRGAQTRAPHGAKIMSEKREIQTANFKKVAVPERPPVRPVL